MTEGRAGAGQGRGSAAGREASGTLVSVFKQAVLLAGWQQQAQALSANQLCNPCLPPLRSTCPAVLACLPGCCRTLALAPASSLPHASCLTHAVPVLLPVHHIPWARTGKMLCQQWDGVKADITVLGKALSGGTMPVAAVLADDEVGLWQHTMAWQGRQCSLWPVSQPYC